MVMRGNVATPEAFGAIAERAEALGIDALWCSDHIIMPPQTVSRYPVSPDGELPISWKERYWEPFTVMAYLAARRKHGLMDKAMWISRNKTPLSRGQGWRLVKVAGLRAGIPDLHPHRFRHSFGHNWMMAGGNETDLMKVAGWKSQRMVARYGQSAAAERALAAHERLQMGDEL